MKIRVCHGICSSTHDHTKRRKGDSQVCWPIWRQWGELCLLIDLIPSAYLLQLSNAYLNICNSSPIPFCQTKTCIQPIFFHLWGNFDNLHHTDTLWRHRRQSILFSLQPNKKTKNAPKIANARPPVTSVKVRRVKSAKGNIREQHDLIVNIDLVSTTRPRFNDDKPKIWYLLLGSPIELHYMG